MTEQSSRVSKRETHPLLGAFPLTVMSFTIFVIVFVLMMARLTAGADPALRAAGNAALVERHPGSLPLSTKTSGAVAVAGAVTGAGPSNAEPAGQGTPALVTHTSGTSGRAGDD